MQRLKGVLQYDGTAYRGWQRQPDAPTVQESCEAALSEILGAPTDVVAAGRTDTGVHARGQVVHLSHAARIAPGDLRRAWNARLPKDIWVERLAPAAADFHARHDAEARTYRYFVAQGGGAGSPFVRRYAWALSRFVDWERAERATAALVGAHDFRAFAKGTPPTSRSDGPPGRCVVRRAEWVSTRHGRAFVVTADRFLRHMVRALVGALVAVGQGRIEPAVLAAALDPGGARPKAGYAPPHGLFLWRVDYPRRSEGAKR